MTAYAATDFTRYYGYNSWNAESECRRISPGEATELARDYRCIPATHDATEEWDLRCYAINKEDRDAEFLLFTRMEACQKERSTRVTKGAW